MRIYRFDADVGRTIDAFDSVNFALSKIVRLDSDAHVSCAYLGPNGGIGYHQAVVPQLLLIMQGEGWVRDEASDRIPIKVGQAVFWEKDEWHETGAGAGLMAIIIESETLDPAEFMPPTE